MPDIKSLKSFFKNLALFTITLIVLCFILEGIFRLARHDDALKLSMGRVDTRYHHTFEPNSTIHMVSSFPGEYDVTAHINREGFRGPDIRSEKPEGVKRIFIVGDSFTFGVGAEDDETIPAQLQKRLDPTGQSVEVVNVGRGSTSPLIFYLRLRDEIPKYKPDLVVMMLDFSDLWEDWNFEKNIVTGPGGEILRLSPYYEYGKFQWWNYLRANSVFAAYLHNKLVRPILQIKRLGFRRYVKEVVFERKKAKALIANQEGDTIAHDGRMFLRGSEKKDEIVRHFQRTAKYISMCRQIAEASGARFILVMYPYGTHVGPGQWGKGRVFWGFKEDKLYTDTFSFDLVARYAGTEGIPFINLLPDLLSHADVELFFPYDGHFTPVANRFVAEALSQNPIFQKELNETVESLKH